MSNWGPAQGRSWGPATITCTRAELEGAGDLWRWMSWCRAWGIIGWFVADVARRERALWSES